MQFFGTLDQAQVNAKIFHTCKYNKKNEENKKLLTKSTMKQLIMHLLELHLQEKLQNKLDKQDQNFFIFGQKIQFFM